jgi:hypothetical protein
VGELNVILGSDTAARSVILASGTQVLQVTNDPLFLPAGTELETRARTDTAPVKVLVRLGFASDA